MLAAMPSRPHTPARNARGHAPAPRSGARTRLLRVLVPMSVATAVAIALGSLPLLVGCALVWAGWLVRIVLLTQVLDPHGDSTPSVNQHSQIATMAVRGEHARAAAAYRDAIAADPRDVVACEHLALLAQRELKDYDLAIWALREAERRSPDARRRRGYAMRIAGLYREELADGHRTMVELRRILSLYPDVPSAPALRAELARLKAGRDEGA